MKRLKIAVLFGGCSPEYSVSLQSAAAVLQNMDSSKYEAVMVGIPCALSCNHGKVLINGYEAPIIGRICMDQKNMKNSLSRSVLSIVGKRWGMACA